MIKNIINSVVIFILLLFVSCGKDKEEVIDNRFRSTVYEKYETQKDIVYSTNITNDGVQKDLKLDLYYPNDGKTDRPLIIFAHGGSFLSGNKSQGKLFAPFFAKSGYVVASIEYRLLNVPLLTFISSDKLMAQAVIDASTDMKSAIRFLKSNAKQYGIDTRKIFIGGYSAGAFTALQTAYVRDLEEIKVLGGDTLVTYVEKHGGIEGDGGNSGSAYPIKGVFNISGAVGNTSILNAGEPPLFSIHGTADVVVPYGKGGVFVVGKDVFGSSEIHKKLEQLGIRNHLYTIKEGDHTAILNCKGCYEYLRSFIYQQL